MSKIPHPSFMNRPPACLYRASYGPLRAAAAYAFLRCRHFDLIYSLFLGVRFAAQPRARQQGSVCSALHRARFARKARAQRRQRIAFLLLEVSLFSRASCDASDAIRSWAWYTPFSCGCVQLVPEHGGTCPSTLHMEGTWPAGQVRVASMRARCVLRAHGCVCVVRCARAAGKQGSVEEVSFQFCGRVGRIGRGARSACVGCCPAGCVQVRRAALLPAAQFQ